MFDQPPLHVTTSLVFHTATSETVWELSLYRPLMLLTQWKVETTCKKHQKTPDLSRTNIWMRERPSWRRITMLGNECSSPDIVALFYNIYIFSTALCWTSESNLRIPSTDAHLPRCSTWDLCLQPTPFSDPRNPSSPDLVEYCGLSERNSDDSDARGWLLYMSRPLGPPTPCVLSEIVTGRRTGIWVGWPSRSVVWEEHKSIWSCFVFGLLSLFFFNATDVTLLNKLPVWVGNTVWSVSWAHFRH